MVTDARVSIKGTSDGLIVSLGEGDLASILDEFQDRLESQASFFLGGRVALCVEDRALTEEDLQTIGGIVEQAGVTLWAVESVHPETMKAARELGLETTLRPSLPDTASASAPEEPTAGEDMPGIVVRRTLRSGQAIHHTGHITLIGDVNPGAELVAGGDIVVWGRLRGTAHAGAIGDDGAVICALRLAPSQIRIATHIARAPERSRPPKVPEMASIQDGGIVVEQWKKR
jgi:septum site-determining protein MinC